MPTESYFEDLGKIIVQYSGDRDTAENVLWFSSTGIGGATLAELNSFAASFYSLWSAAVVAMLPTTTEVIAALVSDWTSADGLTGEQTGTDAGTGDGAATGAQVSALINWLANGRFRGGHPRTYLPNPASGNLENNQNLTSDSASALAASIGSFLTDFNELTIADAAVELVLYHRGPTAAHPDRIAQGVKPIIGGDVPTRLATQRRRVRRVGHER